MKREIGTRTELFTEDENAITVKNLHKSFRLPTEQAFGLKQAFFNRLKGIKGYKDQKVFRRQGKGCIRNRYIYSK